MSKLKPDISALEAIISGKQNALGVIGTYEAVLEECLQKKKTFSVKRITAERSSATTCTRA